MEDDKKTEGRVSNWLYLFIFYEINVLQNFTQHLIEFKKM